MDVETIAATTVDLLGDYFNSLEPLTQFRHKLIATFSESELRDLCFDLGIDFEELPGETKSDKARELIAYCLRRGLVFELLTQCAQLRPTPFSPPQEAVTSPEM
jgi:hypothetical protein